MQAQLQVCRPLLSTKWAVNKSVYDGVGIYDCTNLPSVVLSLGLPNDSLQNVLYGVHENSQSNADVSLKTTFPIMFFCILQRHLYKVCSPECFVFHHAAWHSHIAEDGHMWKKHIAPCTLDSTLPTESGSEECPPPWILFSSKDLVRIF